MAIYLKFEVKIMGESKAKGYEEQIPIEGVQWGCGRGISVVGGGNSRETSKAAISEVTLSKSTDISSPDLFIQSCVGKSLTKATLTWVNSGGVGSENQVYQTIVLDAPIISSYSQSSQGDRPMESFSINFDAIEFFFQGWDGNAQTKGPKKSFDVTTGVAK